MFEIEKDLEPCPICKRKVRFNRFDDNSILKHYSYTIQCPYCGLYMEGYDEGILIKRWNDRENN